MERKNIFDKIMHLPGLHIFEPFYIKHKETLLYLLFGGIAFFLNMFMFTGIEYTLKISELVNNIICWIICVLFQYFTNRTWVFDGKADTVTGFVKQMGAFFGGRIFTLAVEELILAIFITRCGFNSVAVKMIAQVVVVVLNYASSKHFVFADESKTKP